MKFAITRPTNTDRTVYLAKKKQSFGNSLEYTPFWMDALTWKDESIAQARAAKEGNGATVVPVNF